ncbi:MAG: LiaF transmembrane domain-containing protein [Culicoidibacterales bacterium]
MGTIISRILLGLSVIAFGLLMLLDNLGYLAFWEIFNNYWPVILILIGTTYLFRKLWLSAFFFTIIGFILIALNLGLIDGSLWTYIIPIGVIVIGLALLLPTTARRSRENNDNYYQDQRETMNLAAILGGSIKKVISQQFRAGDVLAVFGGATLDLRSAQLAEQGAKLEVTSVFGGIDLLVPADWTIDVRITSIFGGVDDRRKDAKMEGTNKPILVIHGVCFFGGLDIKSE